MTPFVQCRQVQKGDRDLCGVQCGFTTQALRTTLCMYLLGPNEGWLWSVSHDQLHAFHITLCRKKAKETPTPKIPSRNLPDHSSLQSWWLPSPESFPCSEQSQERRTCDHLCFMCPSLNPGVPESPAPNRVSFSGLSQQRTRDSMSLNNQHLSSYGPAGLKSKGTIHTELRRLLPESPQKLFWRFLEEPCLQSSVLRIPLPYVFFSISSRDMRISIPTHTPPEQQPCIGCHICIDPDCKWGHISSHSSTQYLN
jgi:hypothetical protein